MAKYRFRATYEVTVEREHDTDYGVSLEQAMKTAAEDASLQSISQGYPRNWLKCTRVEASLPPQAGS